MTKTNVKVRYFVAAPELRKYVLGCDTLDIMVTPDVFPFSNHGGFYLEHVLIHPQELVIDIGTGTGVLAIAAAKQGALVHATDISEKAVVLARENARRNKVDIECKIGSYFAGFEGKYDVILANLPQEIVPSKYKKALGPELTSTIDGGKYGNEAILGLLDCAQEHMHENSRLYLMIHSLTDYRQTMQAVIARYDAKLLGLEIGATKEFVKDNAEQFWKLNRQGIIDIFEDKKEIKAMVYLFELKLKR